MTTDPLYVQMTFESVVPMEFIDNRGLTWEACCEHCGCTAKTGHDDICAQGCNDL